MTKIDQYDPDYTQRCFEENLSFLHDEYFRVSLKGSENIPFEENGRPVLFVANHSGMTISWDNIMFDTAFYEALKHEYTNDMTKVKRDKLVRLADPKLMSSSRTRLFDLKDWWARTRCVPISMHNLDEALKQHRFTFMSPEGVAGISKGFNKRYQLQKFSSSFVYMAIKHNALVVPVTIVNAEYLRPFNYKSTRVNKLMEKVGYPFFPLGLATSQLMFPATVMTTYPAQLRYEIHPAVSFDGNLDKLSRQDLKNMAEDFRQTHQLKVNNAVSAAAKRFNLKTLLKQFIKSKRKHMFFPIFWHDMFLKTDGQSVFKRSLYKIPLGFPLIALYHWFTNFKQARKSKADLKVYPITLPIPLTKGEQ